MKTVRARRRDLAIISAGQPITAATASRIREAWQEKTDIPCVILGGNAAVQIVRARPRPPERVRHIPRRLKGARS